MSQNIKVNPKSCKNLPSIPFHTALRTMNLDFPLSESSEVIAILNIMLYEVEMATIGSDLEVIPTQRHEFSASNIV